MRIESPLSNLSETITRVKESATRYRDTLQRNEAATRAVLIDPILQALGWDTSNTQMVEVEKSLEQTRVDYALYDRDTNVGLIVEAKPLGTNLDDNSITRDIFKYVHLYRAPIFVTDGLIWKDVIFLAQGQIDFNMVDFKKDNVIDCAAYLVQRLDAARFWPEEETIDELTQRITLLESDLASLQRKFSNLQELGPLYCAPVLGHK